MNSSQTVDRLIPFYSPLRDGVERWDVLVKGDATDPNVIYIEASNEVKDQQKEILFMKALEEEAESFLRKGVLSWDHQHKIKDDPAFIVGEPLDVKFMKAERKTWVKGKLYKTVEFAQKILNLLKGGCTRLGASVGGSIRQRRPLSKATSGILKVIWDELAITYKPVNELTMGNVSLIPIGAFTKALMVGGGVNAALFTGGRAMVPESLQGGTDIHRIQLQTILNELVLRLSSGDIRTAADLRAFLAYQRVPHLYEVLAKLLVKRFLHSEVFDGKQNTREFSFS